MVAQDDSLYLIERRTDSDGHPVNIFAYHPPTGGAYYAQTVETPHGVFMAFVAWDAVAQDWTPVRKPAPAQVPSPRLPS